MVKDTAKNAKMKWCCKCCSSNIERPLLIDIRRARYDDMPTHLFLCKRLRSISTRNRLLPQKWMEREERATA